MDLKHFLWNLQIYDIEHIRLQWWYEIYLWNLWRDRWKSVNTTDTTVICYLINCLICCNTHSQLKEIHSEINKNMFKNLMLKNFDIKFHEKYLKKFIWKLPFLNCKAEEIIKPDLQDAYIPMHFEYSFEHLRFFL